MGHREWSFAVHLVENNSENHSSRFFTKDEEMKGKAQEVLDREKKDLFLFVFRLIIIDPMAFKKE